MNKDTMLGLTFLFVVFILGVMVGAVNSHNFTSNAWEKWLLKEGVAEWSADENGNPVLELKE